MDDVITEAESEVNKENDNSLWIEDCENKDLGRNGQGMNARWKNSTSQNASQLIYKVDDNPPIYLAIIFGLQQLFVCFGGIYTSPVATANLICAELNIALKTKMFSSMLIVVAIDSILMAALGVRLPIIQGAASSFIPVTTSLVQLKEWHCPENFSSLPVEQQEEEALIRLREISGALMAASAIQILIGMFGLVGYILKFIGPLTLAPSVALIGINLYQVINDMCEKQWAIAMFTVTVALISSLCIGDKLQLPIPDLNAKSLSRRKLVNIPIFTVFPIMFGLTAGWILCGILTAANVFPDDPAERAYWARTDANVEFVSSAPWFAVPYPGQFGRPTLGVAAFAGMLVAVFAGIIESVGDYYVLSSICELPAPPSHAVNRGVLTEGVGCFLAGAMGGGVGLTSYSNSIGAVALIKVTCRSQVYTASVIMVICGLLPKVGAAINTMPLPVTGGIFYLGMAMVSAVGISSLQHMDFNSSRNLTILGLSILIGVMMPEYVKANPDAFNTGISEIDQIASMLLSMGFFVGGCVGFVLDNVVPGTLEERGIIFLCQPKQTTRKDETRVYDLPYVTDFIGKCFISKYIPFLPQYKRKRESGIKLSESNVGIISQDSCQTRF